MVSIFWCRMFQTIFVMFSVTVLDGLDAAGVPCAFVWVSSYCTFVFLIGINMVPPSMVRLISIGEFILLVLWFANVCFYSFYFTAYNGAGKYVEHIGIAQKITIVFSVVNFLFNFVALYLQMAYVHIPSWKQGVQLQYSFGCVFAEEYFIHTGDLELDSFALVPQTENELPDHKKTSVDDFPE